MPDILGVSALLKFAECRTRFLLIWIRQRPVSGV